MLFTKVVILLCFLHGWLKIRDRAKHLKRGVCRSLPAGLGYLSPPDRRSFAQRLPRSASGRPDTPQGSSWRRSWTCVAKATAGRLPTATPAPPHEQHARPTDARHEPLLRSGPTPARLAGGLPIALSCRALLCNFTPWHPAVAGENQGWRCPAERLNQHRYHNCWLQNLLISASLGGYRRPAPQNQ